MKGTITATHGDSRKGSHPSYDQKTPLDRRHANGIAKEGSKAEEKSESPSKEKSELTPGTKNPKGYT